MWVGATLIKLVSYGNTMIEAPKASAEGTTMEAPQASTVWGLEKRIPPKLTRESGVHVHSQPLAIFRADVELI